MKLQILSDLHTEFWPNPDISWLVPEDPPDVLVLAGDIGVMQNLRDIDLRFITEYKRKRNIDVMSILGNHEFYHSSFDKVEEIYGWKPGSVRYSNDHKFINCTMWFPNQPENEVWKHNLNDFHLIKDFEKEVYTKNKEQVKFLEEEVEENSIVITHHCPSHRSTPERYKDSELNRFFVCDMESLILERQPKLWIHGHTHDSCDYYIGNTRVICNPFGYLGHEENPEFQKHLIVEV